MVPWYHEATPIASCVMAGLFYIVTSSTVGRQRNIICIPIRVHYGKWSPNDCTMINFNTGDDNYAVHSNKLHTHRLVQGWSHLSNWIANIYMFKSVGYILYASSFLLLSSSSHRCFNISHHVTALLPLPSWLLVEVLPLLTVLLLLFFPWKGASLLRSCLSSSSLIPFAVSGYLRLIAVDCWLISTNSDWLAVMVPMEPHVPSWYHRKAWSKNRSMMVPNGTKSPECDHRKPGTMVPWYPNLWIYRSVRTALSRKWQKRLCITVLYYLPTLQSMYGSTWVWASLSKMSKFEQLWERVIKVSKFEQKWAAMSKFE